MSLILYHNPLCSKSRQAKALLDERGVNYQCIEYLKTPPDRDTLAAALAALEAPPASLVRTGDAAFAESGRSADDLDADTVARLLAHQPALMQRPLAVAGDRAVIGRPPERILELVPAP